MTLHECLKSLPPELVLRDHASIKKEHKTIAQWLLDVHDEDGYEVRDSPRNYGQTSMKCIGLIGGVNMFSEVTGE